MLGAHEDIADEWGSSELSNEDGATILAWTSYIMPYFPDKLDRYHKLRGQVLLRKGPIEGAEVEIRHAVRVLNLRLSALAQSADADASATSDAIIAKRRNLIYLHAKARLILMGTRLNEIGPETASASIAQLLEEIKDILKPREETELRALTQAVLEGDFAKDRPE